MYAKVSFANMQETFRLPRAPLFLVNFEIMPIRICQSATSLWVR